MLTPAGTGTVAASGGEWKMRHSLVVSSSVVMCTTVALYFFTLTLWQPQPEINEAYTRQTGVQNGAEIQMGNAAFQFVKDPAESLAAELNQDSVEVYERKKLLIFTTMRSGSSFIGELFQQNPEFFYMFEPLKMISLDLNGYLHTQRNSASYVNDLLECKFSKFSMEARTRYGTNRTSFLLSWYRRAFCAKLNEKRCNRINSEYLETMCGNKKHVAMKTILLNQGHSIPPILQKGVYVLHLLRDPRGIISSMKRINFRPLLSRPNQYTSNLCKRLQSQIKYVSDHLLMKIRRYMLVRYEDIALAPVDGANTLYKFLQIPVSTDVIRWIHNSTTVDKMSTRAFSTKRNSTKTVSSWRKYLTWEEADDIQQRPECRSVLESLGYVIFSHAEEYHDDSLSSIGLLPHKFLKNV